MLSDAVVHFTCGAVAGVAFVAAGWTVVVAEWMWMAVAIAVGLGATGVSWLVAWESQ